MSQQIDWLPDQALIFCLRRHMDNLVFYDGTFLILLPSFEGTKIFYSPSSPAKALSNGARTSRSTRQNANARRTSPARTSPTSKAHTIPRPSRSSTTTSPKHNSSSTDRTWSGASEPSQKHATDTSTSSQKSTRGQT